MYPDQTLQVKAGISSAYGNIYTVTVRAESEAIDVISHGSVGESAADASAHAFTAYEFRSSLAAPGQQRTTKYCPPWVKQEDLGNEISEFNNAA